MPQVSVDDLLRAARAGKPVAPVIYLHGPEDLLKDEIVRTVIEQVLDPGLREFNLDQRSAAQLDPEAVYSLCHTPPMMAERRVVVIRDVEAWRGKTKAKAKDVVLRYLEQPSADTIVFLVQGGAQEEEDKEFAKRALAVCCEPLPPERAIKWVLRRARQRGVAIDPAAAEHLVRAVGCDLSALASEFDKLAALAGEGAVTAERVGEIVGIRQGETLADWRDAVLDGDAPRAGHLLAPVLAQAGMTGVRLVTSLGTTLVGLGAARSFYERGLRGAQLEEAVFKLLMRARLFGFSYREESRRWARWAPAWSHRRLRAALRAALAADTALKHTTISDEHAVVLDLVLTLTLLERKVA